MGFLVKIDGFSTEIMVVSMKVLEFIEKYRQSYESTPSQLAETCNASFGANYPSFR